jgi:hypothetical protein
MVAFKEEQCQGNVITARRFHNVMSTSKHIDQLLKTSRVVAKLMMPMGFVVGIKSSF